MSAQQVLAKGKFYRATSTPAGRLGPTIIQLNHALYDDDYTSSTVILNENFNPEQPTMSLFRRRQTKRQMVTLEDWFRGIQHVRNPLDLTIFLLSSPEDWDFNKKVQLLLLLPKKAIRDATGMNLLEIRLEDAGQPQLAQVVRWLCFQNLPWRFQMSNRLWCYMKMGKDDVMSEIVQRSAYIKEELQTMQTSLELLETNANSNTEEAIDKCNQINQYKTELQLVEGSYREFNDVLWGVEKAIPVGPLGRAFRAFRKNPDWYLSSQMRQACANQGGCCGRACGCCEKDREISFRKGKRGHCSGFCGCCLRTHGKQYKGIETDEVRATERLGFGISLCLSVCTGSLYLDRKCRAYLWGVGFVDEHGLL